jgi:hypothetical protein
MLTGEVVCQAAWATPDGRRGVSGLGLLAVRATAALLAPATAPPPEPTPVAAPPPAAPPPEPTPVDLPLPALTCDILEALRRLRATGPDNRTTGRAIAAKVGGDATKHSVKEPLADLKRRGLVDSRTGRNGGTWLTETGLNLINSLRPNG